MHVKLLPHEPVRVAENVSLCGVPRGDGGDMVKMVVMVVVTMMVIISI